jgi:transposase
VLGFGDECWWSRLKEPNYSAWSPEDEVVRLPDKSDGFQKGEPKALACYGLLRGDTGKMLLRFVQGRPISEITEAFLAWICEVLATQGKQALLLIWDNAAWHTSQRVRAWIRRHNRQAKRHGGVRIVVCWLPIKSPWLNNIEPKWVHGKRAVAEPKSVLACEEVVRRACAYYAHPVLPHLSKTAA